MSNLAKLMVFFLPSLFFRDPGLPINKQLCPPAAAISKALFIFSCPLTSLKSNKLLAFVSGVLYAMDGKILKIQARMFLLARKEEFEDGTLYQYYEDLK